MKFAFTCIWPRFENGFTEVFRYITSVVYFTPDFNISCPSIFLSMVGFPLSWKCSPLYLFHLWIFSFSISSILFLKQNHTSVLANMWILKRKRLGAKVQIILSLWMEHLSQMLLIFKQNIQFLWHIYRYEIKSHIFRNRH